MLIFVAYVLLVFCCDFTRGCKTSVWRNMTMEELLLKSDIVVYGQDREHRKLRTPLEVDSRFDVYCVLKTGLYQVPGQVIIENIRGEGDECSGVDEQTKEGNMYIVGLTRTLNGFMKYADINPLQKTAFPPTSENFDKIIATCGLDTWTPPRTGAIDGCPVASKPRFCTKIRDPTKFNTAVATTYSVLVLSVISVSIFMKFGIIQG
ncbi:uncharacterized protein LOC132741741 [Ruditapes philippinarum]|uniref:uncharacterized protein LOC132741741 n=1 Tax=Ruditapes philippinarum TaxID=129788 RepID=UPI00295AEBBE|nr:uncharacterized protein LOC132741741 [Ruditapes philippinarum]